MSVSKSRAQSAEQMKSTFGQQGNVVLPSTLNYKERTELKRQSAFEYGRIFNHTHTRGMSVYDRLTADAGVRQTLKHAAAAASPTDTSSFAAMAQAAVTCTAAGMDSRTSICCNANSRQSSHIISGFVSNNNSSTARKQQETACSAEPPLSALHPITLRSYYKKFPVDFLAAARPHVRTTNETMRMLGTYSSDQAVAQRLGVHIPQGCSCAHLDAVQQTQQK